MSCNAVLTAWLVHVQALWEHLEGPAAAYWQTMLLEWPALHRKLVARRCRLPADLQHIFGIRPRAGAAPIMRCGDGGTCRHVGAGSASAEQMAILFHWPDLSFWTPTREHLVSDAC